MLKDTGTQTIRTHKDKIKEAVANWVSLRPIFEVCDKEETGYICGGIDENYRAITLILKKYGNLPLYLENYALFSLPPIFTTILYTYPLSYIIYLGEPLGSIISNYHGTFIHIFMDTYDPIFKIYK